MKAHCRTCDRVQQVPFGRSVVALSCDVCGRPLHAPPAEDRKPMKRPAPKRPVKSFTAASPDQRAKVAALGYCLGCGVEASEYVRIDPAHVVARSKGGCDHEDCVVGLCRISHGHGGCHRKYDDGELDLLAVISTRWPAELREVQHALEHLHPVGVIQQLANDRVEWRNAA